MLKLKFCDINEAVITIYFVLKAHGMATLSFLSDLVF